MVEFRRSFSGAWWERLVGYRRSLRAGNHVFVTGTATGGRGGGGGVHARGDAYEQTRRCLETIRETLAAQGARTWPTWSARARLSPTSRGWEEHGPAHRETFGEHPPATTLVEVSALIDPDMLVEVEADAVLGDGAPPG